MKKIIGLLILLTQLVCNSYSQDSLNFKVQYKPEMSYNQTMEQTMQSEFKYSGSEEFLKTIKEKGIQNPTITNRKSKVESVFKTGKLKEGTTGSGIGKLTYDIHNNYYLKYQIDAVMQINLKLDNYELNVKNKVGFIQSTIITKN
ncbi:MAG TPA: hypothetical protein VIH57_21470 [Bacteroidales bacterium]